MEGYKLRFNQITKSFPGVLALDDVSFSAEPGEVLGLVGENGAGKSTLLKILNGDYIPNNGHISLNDEIQHFSQPIDALHKGISIIYQERHVVPYLTVAENLYLGRLPNRMKFLDRKSLYRNAEDIIENFCIGCKPTDRVGTLSVAQQQMVEIAKDYLRDSRIIAFDEPTASLSEKEIYVLFQIINKMKDEGRTILYVSHRMNEIFEMTDKIVVLKDGRFIDSIPTASTNEKELVKMMVGREIEDIFSYQDSKKSDNPLLKVENLRNENISDINFKLYGAEVLGIAGLVGAGRSELVQAIFGSDTIENGTIFLDEEQIRIRNPRDAINAGIALCPEDRKNQALIMKRTVRENLSQIMLPSITRMGFIDMNREKELSREYISKLGIKTPSMNQLVQNLSGGNQQKTILARWLCNNPKVILLDEPTRGIDVGAKAEIYKIINTLKDKGVGIIVISSELPEILGVCDRILVMRNGKIAGELSRKNASEEKILELAMLENDNKGEC